MSETARILAVGFTITTALVVVVAFVVALSTNRGSMDPEEAAHRERTWLWIVLALMGALLIATVFAIPYFDDAEGAGRQTVRVEAFQFGFRIEPDSVAAGEPVEFEVRAREVNHGFAIYDSRDRLVLQVQAMPERVQEVVHTFEQPGRYRVLCLEFCGSGHQAMVSQLRVTR
ncbi:MAG TPA: hypothetical protein VHH55_03965 [Gaiellaceae bacterium]|nr:hypothetical protein [Gaiellaceae bacterium]